jgi:hypothetical protein
LSSRDKKARHAALRDFLVETPDVLERATASLGWLVVMAAIALGALLLYLLFARSGHPPMPPPGDNPQGALYVRDLGRLPDGRHTFDLVYALDLRNPGSMAYTTERLALRDPPAAGDVIDLGPAPDVFTPPAAPWHQAFWQRTSLPGHGGPGQSRVLRAHFRINASPDRIADLAIGYGLVHEQRGWFGHRRITDDDGRDEEVQLGAVLRAHCPLGVKIQNGETKSLCGS